MSRARRVSAAATNGKSVCSGGKSSWKKVGAALSEFLYGPIADGTEADRTDADALRTEDTDGPKKPIQTEDEKVAGDTDTDGPKKPIQTEDDNVAGDTDGPKKPIQTEDENVAGDTDTDGPKKPIQTEDEKVAGDKKPWVKLHRFWFGPPPTTAAGRAAGPPKRVSAAEEVTLKDISNIASDAMLLSATVETAAKVAGAVSWMHKKGAQEGSTAIVKNILGHDAKEESLNVKMVAESVDILKRESAMIKDTLARLDEELLPPKVVPPKVMVVSQPVSSDPPKEVPEGPEDSDGGGPWEDLF